MEAWVSGAEISLVGTIDSRCSAQLREALYDHIDSHPEADVVVNLSQVRSLDLTSVRLLAAAALKLERVGRHLVLRGCSPSLRRFFASTGWRRLFLLEREAEGGAVLNSSQEVTRA